MEYVILLFFFCILFLMLKSGHFIVVVLKFCYYLYKLLKKLIHAQTVLNLVYHEILCTSTKHQYFYILRFDMSSTKLW